MSALSMELPNWKAIKGVKALYSFEISLLAPLNRNDGICTQRIICIDCAKSISRRTSKLAARNSSDDFKPNLIGTDPLDHPLDHPLAYIYEMEKGHLNFVRCIFLTERKFHFVLCIFDFFNW